MEGKGSTQVQSILVILSHQRGEGGRRGNRNTLSLSDNYERCNLTFNENTRREKGVEEIFEIIMTEFLQINVRHQVTDPGSSENTRINAKTTKQNYT